MITIFKPLPFMQIFATCVDDTKPNFEPNNWIQNDKTYKVTGWTNALNCSSTSLIIANNDGQEIHPNENVKGFRAERFVCFSVILN